MTHSLRPTGDQLSALVLAVLTRHNRVPDEPGWHVQVAPGGSADRTFSVRDPTGVPRLTARLARLGMADRLSHEERILQELAREGASALIDVADRGGTSSRPSPRDVALIEDNALTGRWLLVHEHMPGQPAPLAKVSTAARERLGECLAWIHGHSRAGCTIWPLLETEHGTRVDLYQARLATLRRYRSAQGLLPEVADLIDLLAGVNLSLNAGWHERDFALCHGDLSIGNILWNGDAVALIDWEFARDGDPAEDIAYLVAEQAVSPDLMADIAEAYVAAAGDPWAFARLPVWLPLVALDAALWWADYHLAQGVGPDGQPDVALRLSRAQGYLRHGA
ncbi:MAG: aminoglycoside phosphotransferase family protein [Chloroflexota bacterium]|nr:aminoglycoside phosphotransferase family protein [Chloroflexota bacterium]